MLLVPALRRGSGRAAWRRLSVALDGRTLLEETDVTLHDGRLLGVLPSFTDSGAGSAHVPLGASMRARACHSMGYRAISAAASPCLGSLLVVSCVHAVRAHAHACITER